MVNEARPARSRFGRDHGFVDPLNFVFFPAVEHFREKLLAILKVPVKTAFADAQITGQQFDTHRLHAFAGKARERGSNPIVGLERRRFQG